MMAQLSKLFTEPFRFNYRAAEYLSVFGLERFYKWYDYMSWSADRAPEVHVFSMQIRYRVQNRGGSFS